MARTFTLEGLHAELRVCGALARRYVVLRVLSRVSAYRVSSDGDSITVDLNPTPTKIEYLVRPSAPKWLADRLRGLFYDERDQQTYAKSEQEVFERAYGVVSTIILRHRGFNGYIQDELPF